MSDAASLTAQVDAWLQPLPGKDAPCGSDLGHDVEFLAMSTAAAGRPQSQFGVASPPDWRAARSIAEQLMLRTRDLRVAIIWARAALSLEGFAALGPGLRLVQGLLARHWDHLHPMADADTPDDHYGRLNALLSLSHIDGLFGDLRRAKVVADRAIGELTIRSVELAVGTLQPRGEEQKPTREQVQQMLGAALKQTPSLRSQVEAPRATLEELESLLVQKVSFRSGDSRPDFASLRSVLDHLTGLLPAAPSLPVDPPPGGVGPTLLAPVPPPAPVVGLAGSVRSRDEAVRAIDMVCDYLDQAEPASPAPLLLRRARKMINQNFLQLIQELAPSAVAEVAKVMGVDPATVKPQGPA